MTAEYAGGELELFAAAGNWKRYVARMLGPFVGTKVLEVGAGIGSNIPYLSTASVREWTSLEPDPIMARRIAARVVAGELPAARVVCGTTDKLGDGERFDTIFYLDVLEHIAEDRVELARAATHLAPDGALVVLAPAHQFLFSPFDAAVGHYRRYTRASLAALTPPGCRIVASMMLDSVGFFASLANRMLLSSALPTRSQIAFWDKVLVTLSRMVDRLTFYCFGKTVIVVWRRAE